MARRPRRSGTSAKSSTQGSRAVTRPPEGSPEEIIWLRGYEAGVEQMRKDTKPIIEQLRADKAALWERVKRWEPGADPASWGSGSMIDKREPKA